MSDSIEAPFNTHFNELEKKVVLFRVKRKINKNLKDILKIVLPEGETKDMISCENVCLIHDTCLEPKENESSIFVTETKFNKFLMSNKPYHKYKSEPLFEQSFSNTTILKTEYTKFKHNLDELIQSILYNYTIIFIDINTCIGYIRRVSGFLLEITARAPYVLKDRMSFTGSVDEVIRSLDFAHRQLLGIEGSSKLDPPTCVTKEWSRRLQEEKDE